MSKNTVQTISSIRLMRTNWDLYVEIRDLNSAIAAAGESELVFTNADVNRFARISKTNRDVRICKMYLKQNNISSISLY